jgi:CheY-like chemotaxis protein
MKILIVDDTPSNRCALETLLTTFYPEAEVATACGGLEAQGLLANEQFDVVITDYQMQDIDGLFVCRAARQHCPRATIILMSGMIGVDPTLQDKAVASGVTNCLQKPFDLEELRALLPKEEVSV